MRASTIENWKRRCNLLREVFGDSLFTAAEAAPILGLTTNSITHVFKILARRRLVFCVAHSMDLREYNPTSTSNYYSFNGNWTLDDVIDEICAKNDPVPEEDRTLEIQLFGDERKRYEEIRARRMRYGTMRINGDALSEEI